MRQRRGQPDGEPVLDAGGPEEVGVDVEPVQLADGQESDSLMGAKSFVRSW
jgi:hypothetical protein